MELFIQLAIIIICTKFAGDISVRLGQPSVLGKLIIGVIIGPALLGWIDNGEVIEALSHLGVLFLMFIAGLETDLNELNKNRNASIAAAVGGVILPLLGGYFAGLAFGFEINDALFLGLLLSATSVSISVQTFKDMGQLNSRESTTVLGAAILDDILVVVALAFMMSFFSGEAVSISSVIGKKLIFFAIIILLAWKVIPFVMKKLAALKITEPVMSVAVVFCLLFAYIAEYFGVAGIIGSFAAGIGISQTDFKKEVERKIEPIAYTLFVPVFFVSIGLSVSFEGIGIEQIILIVVLSIIAILTKWIGSGFGARMTGFNTLSSLTIGAGMVSRGEVALILASLGLSSGLLAEQYFTAIIIVVIVTTIFSPPLLKFMITKKASSQKSAS
ncbi:cation:proton antiporter [Bacillaceae bacterium Marseille-Q3522]|nr:cation:proton antiporter [Bacillaceae bacterium Marseille-Q3522]